MIYLVLSILFGLAVCLELWILQQPDVEDEQYARIRIKKELEDIILHRPDHIVGSSLDDLNKGTRK